MLTRCGGGWSPLEAIVASVVVVFVVVVVTGEAELLAGVPNIQTNIHLLRIKRLKTKKVLKKKKSKD